MHNIPVSNLLRARLVSAISGAAALAVISFLNPDPAAAAPGSPVVVASSGQAANVSGSMDLTTTGAIDPGDLIVVLAASGANQTPTQVSCVFAGPPVTSCSTSWDGKAPGFEEVRKAGEGMGVIWNGREAVDNSPIRARSFYTYATNAIASGATIRVGFGGAVGAKAVTVVVIPGAEVSGLLINGGNSSGPAQSGAITSSSPMPVPASSLFLAASYVVGGGTDAFIESSGFTHLHQTTNGAWPTIRVAYRLVSASGLVTYSLTNAAARTWISTYQVAR